MNIENPADQRPSCFVVMPFGRDAEEQKWFRGWYEVVLSPAIYNSGYKPVISAAEEQPGAINDEIRAHLAYDPMVLVDLGGFDRSDDPNPNVMYELGIRHALGLPLVIMAWDGQRLPFDVSNQRVIMHDRALLDIEANKKKIVAFIQAATEGKYYKPMDAVGRMATIAAASESLDEDNILNALVQEVRELKGSVHAVVNAPRAAINWESTLSVKTLLHEKDVRRKLFEFFESLGGNSQTWNKVINKRIPVDFAQTAKNWKESDWKKFVEKEFLSLPIPSKKIINKKQPSLNAVAVVELDEQLIDSVRNALPPQPWPKDTHKAVMSELGINNGQYKRAVVALIRRGIFKQQIDGVLFDYIGDKN